ncbi:hypothetical protein LCI18_010970 [Fusarium solani-melongenae]|uniref:Uncharacterized protein n=1 Tax=Fusarium solani subsp. cucurbitae TaxID=2747967 RepID=A0ACD3ZFN5_FUSSC|nr:hypothetical protein LCI18_010970 [Fusarium solani-melongenae]
MRLHSFIAVTGAVVSSVAARSVLDTPSQQRLDALAGRIHKTRPYDDLVAELRQTFLVTTEQYGYDITGNPTQEKRLDVAMDEFAFSCIQRIVNDDPARPAVYWVESGPRAGVFGGRFGYDNADNIYRTIPVNSSYSYVIRGKRSQIADATFSLQEDWNLTPVTSTLTKEQLVVSEDGSYTITVNSSASDSPNHIKTIPSSRFLMIRNNLGDWVAEDPDYLEVSVVESTAPPTKGLSEKEIIRRAREEMRLSIPTFGQLIQGTWTLSQPQNVIIPPNQNPDSGTLVTQATSFSHANLTKSEAMVITIDSAGAAYWSLVTHNLFQTTVNPRDRTESLNMAQIVPNENGTATMVLSSADPGVHNWLKLQDEGQGEIVTRFQGLPVSNENGGARVKIWSQVVPLEQLAKYLPKGTKRITQAQRAIQIGERQKGWDYVRKF